MSYASRTSFNTFATAPDLSDDVHTTEPSFAGKPHARFSTTFNFGAETGLLTPPSTPPLAPQTRPNDVFPQRLGAPDHRAIEASAAEVERIFSEYGCNAAFGFEYNASVRRASPKFELSPGPGVEQSPSASLRKQMFTSPTTHSASSAGRDRSNYPRASPTFQVSPTRRLKFGPHKRSTSLQLAIIGEITHDSVSIRSTDAESCLQCVELGLGDTCSKNYPTCTRCMSSQHFMLLQGAMDASTSHPCLARTYESGGGVVRLACDTDEMWVRKQELTAEMEERDVKPAGIRNWAPLLHRAEGGRMGWFGCFDILEE